MRLHYITEPRHKGSLVLTFDGNVRAAWDTEENRMVPEFLVDGQVEYVILERRPGPPRVSRVSGINRAIRTSANPALTRTTGLFVSLYHLGVCSVGRLCTAGTRA